MHFGVLQTVQSSKPKDLRFHLPRSGSVRYFPILERQQQNRTNATRPVLILSINYLNSNATFSFGVAMQNATADVFDFGGEYDEYFTQI